MPDAEETKNLVRMLLQGKLQSGEATSLSSFYYLSLNSDNTLCQLDPQIDFNRTRLRRIASLPARGEDLVVSPDGTTVFVTIPETGHTAVIDSLSMTVRSGIPTGEFPREVVLQPDESCVWIVDAVGEEVFAVDPTTAETLASYSVGAGEKEICFDPSERRVYVVTRESGRVSMLPFVAAQAIPSAATEVCHLEEPIRSAAIGSLAQQIYLLGDDGAVRIIDASDGRFVRTIEVDASGPLVADPGGRWIYLIDSEDDAIDLLDTSNGRRTRTIAVEDLSLIISFTAGYAQVYFAKSRAIQLIGRTALGQPGEVPVLRIPVAQADPEEPREIGVGALVVPTPEQTSVLVAIPEEQQLYYYAEGMMAPMGSYRNFSRVPRAIAVLDRSLRESAAGTYSIIVRADDPGAIDVPFFINQPTEVLHRFEINVAPNEHTIAEVDSNRIRAVASFLEAPLFAQASEEVTLRVRLDDPEKDQSVSGVSDLQVFVYQLPGNFQRRGRAREVEPGIYEAKIRLGGAGTYRIRCQAPSQKLSLPRSAEHRFTVTDDVVTTIPKSDEGSTP